MNGARLSSFAATLMSEAYCWWLRKAGVSMASRRLHGDRLRLGELDDALAAVTPPEARLLEPAHRGS